MKVNRAVFRARIDLLCGDGIPTGEIAQMLGTSKQTVLKRRLRFPTYEVIVLNDAPRFGTVST